MNEGGGQCAFVMFSTYPLGGGAAIRREKSLLSLAVLRVVRVSPSHSIKARFTASKLAIHGMEEVAGSRSPTCAEHGLNPS